MMGILGLILFLGLLLTPIIIYNQLIKKRNYTRNSFAQIDVQLQRRHDLVPQLVEVAKRYLSHEENTLTNVITARNQAVEARKQFANAQNTHNNTGVQAVSIAENALSGALSRLMAVSEAYPELKADGLMQELSAEITSTENRIAYARQAYNDAVMDYNNRREIFPNNLIAGLFQFSAMGLLQLDETIKTAPKIQF